MWELDHTEGWALKNWCFRTVVLEKTLESPLDCKISSQSVLKEISPECLWEGLMLKLKLQYLATWCEELTYWKRSWCLERLKAGGEGDNRGWDGGWHHWLNGHEFEQALGVGDGQGRLACCSPWGPKELNTTEWLNWASLCLLGGAFDLTIIFLILLGLFSAGLFLLWCFLPREVSLAFVVKLVWQCWILLNFACMESFWFPPSNSNDSLVG